jgi:hypothetical protein
MTCPCRRRDGGDIAPAHSQPGTGRMWVANTTLRPFYSRERPGTHFAVGGMSLDGTENLAPTARSECTYVYVDIHMYIHVRIYIPRICTHTHTDMQ